MAATKATSPTAVMPSSHKLKPPDDAELMPANGSLIQATTSASLHIMANEALQVLQGLNFFARMKVETTS